MLFAPLAVEFRRCLDKGIGTEVPPTETAGRIEAVVGAPSGPMLFAPLAVESRRCLDKDIGTEVPPTETAGRIEAVVGGLSGSMLFAPLAVESRRCLDKDIGTEVPPTETAGRIEAVVGGPSGPMLSAQLAMKFVAAGAKASGLKSLLQHPRAPRRRGFCGRDFSPDALRSARVAIPAAMRKFPRQSARMRRTLQFDDTRDAESS